MEIISLEKYTNHAKAVNKHPAKVHILSELLEEVFDVKLEDTVIGMEKNTKAFAIDISGSIDLLFKNVIFEVKTDINRELVDAEKQLEEKYFPALLEDNPDGNFIGIVTDVIVYNAYKPIIEGNKIVGIQEIGNINISNSSSKESILWLDSFIFSNNIVKPDADDLKIRFGPKSPTYAIVIEQFKKFWKKAKTCQESYFKFELWKSNMELVYGDEPTTDDFLDHTYLVTLVKLIVYLKLSENGYVDLNDIESIVNGDFFTGYRIINLIEEDFFSWILNPKIVSESSEIIAKLGNQLKYNFSEINEDFFKQIYQELVDVNQRHGLGEYYTPEWLTELTLVEALNIRNGETLPKVLDPACGSGTFICSVLRSYKENAQRNKIKNEEILKNILNNIIGTDINPMAVIISRANYLLALDDLLLLGQKITIPIYFADSIKLPKTRRTILGPIRTIEYEFDGNKFIMPFDVVKNRETLNLVIESLKESIYHYKIGKSKSRSSSHFKNLISSLDSAEINVLKEVLQTIFVLIDKEKDSIWPFILNNIYITVALSESKFDLIVGNPPWIALRYILNPDYQDFIKDQIINEYELLDKDRVELYPHMEIATLFFCKCADLYLKDGGVIAFVMPRSVITGAFHHENFKKFLKPKIKLVKILDFKKVNPIFKVPSCSLIGIKGPETGYPVPLSEFKARLTSSNMNLNDVNDLLEVKDLEYISPEHHFENSVYYEKFKQGASIVPRNFWFIDFQFHSKLGINMAEPMVKSKIFSGSEPKWRDVIEGNIESKFIYSTCTKILPFRPDFTPVILPITPIKKGYKLYDTLTVGNILMETWLNKIQSIWENNAKKDQLGKNPRVVNYLNFRNKLTTQNPLKRYYVVFNKGGANLVSFVVDKQNIPSFNLSGIQINSNGFIVDSAGYYYETDSECEAHYLCAILNSDIINEAKMDSQTEGLYGKRDIHRRPLMFPIPEYDADNEYHAKLAELSKLCHDKASEVNLTYSRINYVRNEIKGAIKDKINKINEITLNIVHLSEEE